jgi:hypothetical protein
MPLTTMVWDAQWFMACGFIAQDSMMKESIEHKFAFKFMTEARCIRKFRFPKGKVVDTSNTLCRSTKIIQ